MGGVNPEDVVEPFASLDEFFLADVRRFASPEADFGYQWRDLPSRDAWTLRYLRDTGEVYAVRLRGRPCGPVWLLAVVPPDGGACWSVTVDRVLAGREAVPPEGLDLSWALARLRRHGRTSVLPWPVTVR